MKKIPTRVCKPKQLTELNSQSAESTNQLQKQTVNAGWETEKNPFASLQRSEKSFHMQNGLRLAAKAKGKGKI